MNSTQMSTVSTTGARTWWWHPRPVVAIETAEMGGAAGTWWWHPRPVA